MKYKPKQTEVEAVQIKKQMGEFLPGDYLVITDDDQFFMKKEEFESKYEEVPFQIPQPIVNYQQGVRQPEIAVSNAPSYASTARAALMGGMMD